MTRLYNYFSLSPARPAFCAAAAQLLAAAAAVPDEAMPGFAATELAMLDRPFTDVYRAFDAWRGANHPVSPTSPPQAIIAIAAAPRTAPVSVHPRLEPDASVFQ